MWGTLTQSTITIPPAIETFTHPKRPKPLKLLNPLTTLVLRDPFWGKSPSSEAFAMPTAERSPPEALELRSSGLGLRISGLGFRVGFYNSEIPNHLKLA